MERHALHSLLRVAGVRGAGLVDPDGLLLLEAGAFSDLLPAQVARIAETEIGQTGEDKPRWREIHAEGWSLFLAPSLIGTFFLVTVGMVNVGRLRLVTLELKEQLEERVMHCFERTVHGGADR